MNALKILLFTVIIYFLSGLARTAGAFFTNYLFVLITYLVMSAFFRVLGTATRGESADLDDEEGLTYALVNLDRLQRCRTIGSPIDFAHGHLRRLHDSRSVRLDIRHITLLANAYDSACAVFTMKRWLFWIYYLNPLSYGFESLMVNEFM